MDSPSITSPPTARDYAGVHRVDAVCHACDHWQQLDLAGLIASGHGDIALIELKLRCGQCGARSVGIIVSGQAYPMGEVPV